MKLYFITQNTEVLFGCYLVRAAVVAPDAATALQLLLEACTERGIGVLKERLTADLLGLVVDVDDRRLPGDWDPQGTALAVEPGEDFSGQTSYPNLEHANSEDDDGC